MKKQSLTYLCIWTFLVCVISCGILLNNRTDTVDTKEEFQGNNVHTYMELIKMPAETVFQNIRVMITNKKDNSIFFKLEDFAKVKKQMEKEGYRGKLIYRKAANEDDGFVVINELSLEEYLYGVVPSEMPSSYPMEALKAQAICARTYAVLYMMNPAYPDYDAHVNDTTSFQVYHNIDEQMTTNQAVDETCGMLLFDESGQELMETFYYSTSCGQSCQASTNVEFKEYISGSVYSDVEVNEGWYRWTCKVTDVNNKAILERLQSRFKVNPSKILTMTQKDTYESNQIKELGAIKELFISKRGDGGVAEELIISDGQHVYKVVGEYNIRYILNKSDAVIVKNDGSTTSMKTLLPSAFISLEAIKSKGRVVGYHIEGGGYGHGMGMSQNGAKGMANLGYSAEEILLYYYPGSKVSNSL